MNRRSLIYLVSTIVVCSLILLVIGLLPRLLQPAKPLILPPNDVRGMAFLSKDQPYTLNFEQQNQIVQAINQGEKIPQLQTCAPSADKLVIYRFNQSDWIISMEN